MTIVENKKLLLIQDPFTYYDSFKILTIPDRDLNINQLKKKDMTQT